VAGERQHNQTVLTVLRGRAWEGAKTLAGRGFSTTVSSSAQVHPLQVPLAAGIPPAWRYSDPLA